MRSAKNWLALLICLLFYAPIVPAQDAPQPAAKTSSEVTIIIQQEQVRFAAPRDVAEMRLQVFDQTGELVYDSGAILEPELNWPLQNGSGGALKSGLYAYTLALKEAGREQGKETTRLRRGHFIVDRAKERDGADKLWVTSQNSDGVGAELTVAKDEHATIAGANIGDARVREQRAPESDRDDERKEAGERQAASRTNAAAASTAGRLAKFTGANNELGDSIIAEQSGNLGIGTASTSSRLTVGTPTGSYGLSHTDGQVNLSSWVGTGQSGASGGWFGTRSNHALHFFTGDSAPMATIATNGNVGIGTTTPVGNLHVHGSTGITVTGPGAGFFFRNRETTTNTNYWAWYAQNNESHLWQSSVGNLMSITTNGVVSMRSLRLTGGADFAENFDVRTETAPAKLAAAPGTATLAGLVVAIDPRNPSKLQISKRAYDRRVAGVISGAGGVKPGMVMGQEGTLADGKQPVALSGRVYVWVDARRSAIRPGDLLTTSATPGHAMKATNPQRAQGAIIGKAMTALKSGKGLVLVLVTLQ